MIRNACVNEGTVESGQEIRNAEVLASFLDGSGADVELFHAAPGRTTLVARVEGSDPSAPSLCLNGHTDVVPVSPDGWSRDPFAAELVDGEIWGRGAVDMLNLTASMAVAVRHLLASGLRPRGDLVLLAVADEESGSRWGARWMAEHHADLITTDFVLTENGGLHGGSDTSPTVSVTVGEKGVAWRRLTVRGTPGHGSMPFRADNALVTAAGVVSRLAEYRPPPMFHELWRRQVAALPVDDETRETLLDPDRIDDLLATMPGPAGHFYSCTHTTFSPNTVTSQSKTNVIPDTVTIDVDVRTLPGEGPEEVEAHLRAALGDDLFARVEVEPLIDDRASTSRTDTPLWDALQRGVARSFDRATLHPQLSVGFTDARVHRELGAIAYGAGLLSPNLSSREFGRRFHGNDERIDVESLGLTTRLWIDVVRDLLG
ncbi:M20/M25/M40 family metallo-hydrolase [Actinomarinicola tropica]|uniref:M20/M25/M40 family metallo-hydrolase n=2 Tax=Actinomarinicola tropica TaxID=2789776 RepID=A0A5Q2RRX5_9ACTN|nr:M20/M25/M40 family metallo-hydrolase [Actinomarinicola tropica]